MSGRHKRAFSILQSCVTGSSWIQLKRLIKITDAIVCVMPRGLLIAKVFLLWWNGKVNTYQVITYSAVRSFDSFYATARVTWKEHVAENIESSTSRNKQTRHYPQGIQRLVSTHQSNAQSSMRSSISGGIFLVSSRPKSPSLPWEVPNGGEGFLGNLGKLPNFFLEKFQILEGGIFFVYLELKSVSSP